MNILYKYTRYLSILAITVLITLLFSKVVSAKPEALILKPFAQLSEESKECVACHKEENKSLYAQWGRSKHFGANVGCYECHKAEEGDKDLIKHEGFDIAVIVSPKDCASCHKQEVDEFSASHHAKAGKIIGSQDNFFAEVIEGITDDSHASVNGASAVAVNGCWQCHGSEVKILENGDLDPATWPNTGIGRLNPDGSVGACSACHQRHEFDIAQARRPEVCGKCHLGPDHPQKEVYEESKHGINFYTHIDQMNLSSSKWIVGEDYDAAPTCATCHVSATSELPITHDVGDRISWTLRPAISEKVDASAIAKGEKVKPWEDRREDMKNVCEACHTSSMVENFYIQFDALVNLYNDKFAKPGKALMDVLYKENMITSIKFDEEIEWTWFYLWHHEGRRARHGAAMQGPDYTHWHGMFEVAEKFYTKLVPEFNEAVHKAEEAGNKEGAERAKKVLSDILSRPEHSWFTGKEPEAVKAARAKAQEEFNLKICNRK